MSEEINQRLDARRPGLESSAEIDPVTAGIIRGSFETICFEMATHLGRAASSAIINQSNERNASIIDANGRLAGLSVGIPQLLFISPMAVRWGLEFQQQDDWGPGDLFVGNDPDHGGGHLPDYTVYAPVYTPEGRLLLIAALQAHQGDTGGKDPGGFSPDSLDIFHEGLAIPGIKLVHRGEKRRDILDLLIRNNRLPSFSGDIAAMIGACELGGRRLEELFARIALDLSDGEALPQASPAAAPADAPVALESTPGLEIQSSSPAAAPKANVLSPFENGPQRSGPAKKPAPSKEMYNLNPFDQGATRNLSKPKSTGDEDGGGGA